MATGPTTRFIWLRQVERGGRHRAGWFSVGCVALEDVAKAAQDAALAGTFAGAGPAFPALDTYFHSLRLGFGWGAWWFGVVGLVLDDLAGPFCVGRLVPV